MREKELRLALVCYGGISLAVYMHGITKEVWHLARASRAFHDGTQPSDAIDIVYRDMLREIEEVSGVRLRVLVDILSGASAGGINAIFLSQAIETGQSLDALTALWLDNADVDKLLDPDARPAARVTKFWATPLVWMAARHPGDTIERTVAPETREEVRHKLSNFIRSRWFEPPFGGAGFCTMLLDAFDAMAKAPAGPTLLPDGHPLDLFVTVTDFDGYLERLSLHSPPQVTETEHRLTIGFRARGDDSRRFADPAELTFAARATASFPGAFPPFTVRELDRVLEGRKQPWAGRSTFLSRVMPQQAALGTVEDAVLIDGSVLANAPFAQAIKALRNRPARREVDRRFVFIDPKPSRRSISLSRSGEEQPPAEGKSPPLPGFFRTIFGALSDIPREQPIRENLEAIEQRSRSIRRMQRITEAMREGIEEDVEAAFGSTLFLDRPTPARLASWRSKAQRRAAAAAGFAYPAYAHLKLSGIVEEMADLLFRVGGDGSAMARENWRQAVWQQVRANGVDQIREHRRSEASEQVVLFFRHHDLGFRIRRLRFLARRLAETLEVSSNAAPEGLAAIRDAIYGGLALYLECEAADYYDEAVIAAARQTASDPAAAMAALEAARDLKSRDVMAEAMLSEALWALPKDERRQILLAYLGFPFYDIATLPLLQGEGSDEYDPVKVDRISPDDCSALRPGGQDVILKGLEFNSFGAFFSRAYREHDYLWGRLHGAERLIDIVISALPAGVQLPEGAAARYRAGAFRAILKEEARRLPLVADLIAGLRKDVG
jgi:patatin-related protein